MSLTKSVSVILNSTITASREIIPLGISIGKPSLVTTPMTQTGYSTLIGITGDMKGRLIIETDQKTIGMIAESMFGMTVEGDMLASFYGELGNMIAGKMSTLSSEGGVTLDITPPTVMSGNSTLYGFTKALKVPVLINESSSMFIILALE